MSLEPEELIPLVIQPTAESEISGAFRWYEDQSAGLGSEFMRALEACFASIRRNPTAYAILRKQVRRAVLRRFPYNVFYRFDGNTVTVIACFHASRNPRQWRDRA